MINDLPKLPDINHDRFTWVVAGHPRSGTSMMMHALSNSGLKVARSIELEKTASKMGLKAGNPNGYFELSTTLQADPFFPAKYQGSLIKVQFPQLGGLIPGNYRVVFMLRNPVEIIKSVESFGNGSLKAIRQLWQTPDEYRALMARYIEAARMRRDMVVYPLWYSEVLSDPHEAFQKLVDIGFPIDIEKAVSVIDPSLYHQQF